MSAGSLVGAAICAGLFTASGLIVAVAVKRVFFAAWRSSLAVVAVASTWICWALVLGQGLGAVGLLRRGPLVATALVTAVAAAAISRRPAVPPPGPAPGPDPGLDPVSDDEAVPAPRLATMLVTATALLVLLVGAIWMARTVITVHRGINDPDSLGYHLPFATTFAQTGSADQHRFVQPSLPVHFYPANDELLSAIALVLTRSVAFAAIKNLLLGGLVLAAAHALGTTFRAGVASVAGAAIALGLPVVAFSQPGEAVNDTLVLVALLAGLAILARARERPAPYVLALACAGVALGDKLSAIVPAAGLGALALVLVYLRVPAPRWRWAGVGALASFTVGGSWYLRNAITYGNPVPPARVALGPVHLRQIATTEGPRSFTVLKFLVHGRFLAEFARGSGQGLGPLVIVVAGLWIYGVIVGLRSGQPFRRGLSALAVVCCVGYLATPASAYGVGPGRVGAFVINLHYAGPALLVGLVSAGMAVAAWRRAWLLPAAGWIVVATGIDAGRRIAFWSPGLGGAGFVVLAVASLAGGAVVWARTQPGRHRWAAAGTVATAAVVVAGGLMCAFRYPSLPSTDPVERWAASVSGVRIAAWVPDVAWLYGPSSPNRVVTLTRLANGAPVAQDSCPAWMQAVIGGQYPYSAVIPTTMWYRWLAADPAFQLVAQNEFAAVFRVVGRPNVECPGTR